MTENIISKAIHLKQNQKLKTTDAVIAATASELKLPVLTADKEFGKIKGLEVISLKIA